MKIAICTGGGDCPGLNAVIRAVVRHAIGTYNWEVIGIIDSFNGLMTRPFDIRQMTIGGVTDIIDRGGTVLGTTNKGNPFKSKQRDDEKEQDYAGRVVDAYKELGLDGMIVVGGDGTQNIAGHFIERGLNIIGVPKTIDNDQAATEVSVGFQTAVDIASDALGRLRSTAESHQRIMVLELMGRDAGHIALHAGIASGANVILIPEMPFEYGPVVKKIQERQMIGRQFSTVVVAEGAYEKGSAPTYSSSKMTKGTGQYLGGIGAIVADRLYQLTQIDTRITVLGHVQRGGTPDPYDRVLGTSFGVKAVELMRQKKFGYVVGMRNGKMTETEYSKIVGKTSPVALDSFYIQTAEAVGICMGRESSYVSR